MTKIVYTNAREAPVAEFVSPITIARRLWTRRELIKSLAEREFAAAHHGTFLGLGWTILSPLIMLALYTFVFGFVFKGRFNSVGPETPTEFALALFVGMSLYQCVGSTLTGSTGLLLSNAAYIKTLSFPLEVLPVAAVLNYLANLAIALTLCLAISLCINGYVHLATISVPLHLVCIGLTCLGLSWFLSSLSLFVRDVPGIIMPFTVILMFISSVFFPSSSVSPKMRWLFTYNPLGVVIEQARGAILSGIWPNPVSLAMILLLSIIIAVFGYWFFMRTKAAFADVL